VKLRREATMLKKKAVSSMRRAAAAFNSYEEDGRTTAVLLHLQHAFEMLLKAGLVQEGQKVFDPNDGKSFGMEKCVNLAGQHLTLTPGEAGTIRTIDALRDEEQHWVAQPSEGILYAHARAGITAFDDILARVFGERIADHLPVRVLPISTEPPKDVQLLISSEYKQIQDLLAPGHRKRPDARAKIGALLAMEAHVAEGVVVSQKDVDRVEKAIRAGKEREQVFPRLSSLGLEVGGSGLTVTVRFTKNQGAPVTFVPADDPADAAAVREIDLQRKYHISAGQLARKLGLTNPKAFALRRYLGIDADPSCRHEFRFYNSVYPAYSDNAYTKMKAAIAEGDMDAIWAQCRPGKPQTA